MSFDVVLLVIYVGGAVSISFLCSILEATLLSVRMGELLQRSKAGDEGATRLLTLKRDRIDDSISAILTLNTVAHTVGAALSGAQAARVFGSQWVGVFSGVLTVVVLVATEIVPKTIGTVYASRLVGLVGRVIQFLTVLLSPILAVTGALTRLLAHGHAETISRGELAALVALAAREGAVRADEKQVFENVLRLSNVQLEDVMTPRTVTAMMPANATFADFLAEGHVADFSRVPLHEESRDEIVGYVLTRDIYRSVALGDAASTRLRERARPLPFLPESTSLADALQDFLRGTEHIAVVTDEFGGVSGIVTMEDVIETVLGVEIVDESDRVTDLRELAKLHRDQRLTRARTPVVQEAPPAG